MDQPAENAENSVIPGYVLSLRAKQKLYRLFGALLGIFIIGLVLGILLTGAPQPLH